MINKILFSLFVILILCSLMYYINKDITTIYNKDIIKGKDLFLNNQNTDNKIINNIIEDKNNTWIFTIATYACDLSVRDETNKFGLSIYAGNFSPIIIRYYHKTYGNIQLISEKNFKGLYDKLNNTIK